MDSFLSKSDNKPTTNTNNSNKTHEHKTSTSELFSSAKVLAEAAKGGEQKLDKDKVADASGDLLCAASQYGKLDETSAIGKSVHQAEEYLHNYNSSSSSPSSHSSTNTNTNTNTNTTNTSDSTPNTNTNTNTNTSHSNAGSDGGGSHAESGGYGGYMKMAEGLFKRN